jgi:endonuclease YncB( thermonuclease family)
VARYEARCIGIRDGDTFVAHYRNISRVPGFKSTLETDPSIAVRLLGIQCPEKKDPGGPEATAFAVEWFRRHMHGADGLGDQNLWLDEAGYDHFTRLLGMVTCREDGSCLNAELLNAGHATVYRGTLDAAAHRAGLAALSRQGSLHAQRILKAMEAQT